MGTNLRHWFSAVACATVVVGLFDCDSHTQIDDVVGIDATAPDVDVDAPRDASTDVAVVPDARMDAVVDTMPDVRITHDVIDVHEAAVDVPPPDVVSGGCTPVAALNPAGDRRTGRFGGRGMIDGAACASGSLVAGEVVYSLHLTQALQIDFDVHPANGMVDPVVSVRAMCELDTSEIACNDNISDGDHGAATRVVLDPGDYAVLVDAYALPPDVDPGFTLTLTSVPPAANADCTMALPLDPSTPRTQQNTLAGMTPSATCAPGLNGPQLFYTLVVPANQRATITATPDAASAMFTPVLRLSDACGAAACLRLAGAPAGMPASTVFDNRGTDARTVIVSVGGRTLADTGSFTLAATLAPLPAQPANAVCANATLLTEGVPVANQDPSLGSDDLSAVCGGASGPSLYYAVDVPAGQWLVATATPDGTLDVVLRDLDVCGATMCDAANRAPGGGAETLRYRNAGTTTQREFLAVSSVDPGVLGTFGLNTMFHAPPVNATCDTATALSNGTVIRGEDVSFAIAAPDGACGSYGLFYQITIPPLGALTVTVTPIGDMDPSVSLLSDCATGSCVGTVDSVGNGAAETFEHTNDSATTPKTITIVVRRDRSSGSTSFDIAATIRQPH